MDDCEGGSVAQRCQEQHLCLSLSFSLMFKKQLPQLQTEEKEQSYQQFLFLQSCSLPLILLATMVSHDHS